MSVIFYAGYQLLLPFSCVKPFSFICSIEVRNRLTVMFLYNVILAVKGILGGDHQLKRDRDPRTDENSSRKSLITNRIPTNL